MQATLLRRAEARVPSPVGTSQFGMAHRGRRGDPKGQSAPADNGGEQHVDRSQPRGATQLCSWSGSGDPLLDPRYPTRSSTATGSRPPPNSWPRCGGTPHAVPTHELAELLLDLNSRSEQFRTRWADHNFIHHRAGDVLLNHLAVGELELAYERLEVPTTPA